MSARRELVLVLVGFGRVARRFVALLQDVEDRLSYVCRIAGVVSPSFGGAFDPAGLAPQRILSVPPRGAWAGGTAEDGLAFLTRVLPQLNGACAEGRVVMIETTGLDASRGEPAIAHVRSALEQLAHVVTANKGPAAFAYRDLSALAAQCGRRFLFESAVMDGVPVFSLAAAMPGVRIAGFRGVVNTTCAFILSAMEAGTPFGEALADMQARGIAESDASLDIDGWDAAAKAAVLANVFLDAGVTPHDVARTGIASLTPADLAAAIATGRRVRLVVSGSRDGDRVDVRVAPLWLRADDPLAALTGVENALALTTDLLGEVAIVQRSGSLTQTAYGLVADLARVAAG